MSTYLTLFSLRTISVNLFHFSGETRSKFKIVFLLAGKNVRSSFGGTFFISLADFFFVLHK
jgi:hypothetical protein